MRSEMKEENKRCSNCIYFSAFYTKKFQSFQKENYGLCNGKKVKERHEVCDMWGRNNVLNRKSRKEYCFSASLNTIDGMSKNLAEISQILREEYERENSGSDEK